MNTHKALIVVDVQNDFCEGGSMGVDGGANVAFTIAEILAAWQDADPGERDYDAVVATRDHHIDPGDHFSDTPDFIDSWPPHCVVGTDGVAFHPNLDPQPFNAIFDKGEYAAAYSGFEGKNHDGTALADWLRGHDIRSVDVVGIATDHCVRATALDAVDAGLSTTVLLGMTAGVSRATTENALTQLRDHGVTLIGAPVVH